MKENLGFICIFWPKGMAFSPLSFIGNIGTPLITISPEGDYSFPLCKRGQEISYYTVFASSRVPEHLKTVYRDGGIRVPWVPKRTRAGENNASLLPSCGHAITNQWLWCFPKNPFVFTWRWFALGSPPGLFSLLKCNCIYQDNQCFCVKGAWISS